MKNKIKGLILLMLLPVIGYTADASFLVTGGSDNNVILTATDSGLTYNKNYSISPGQYGGKKMSASVTYTSTTYSNVAFSTNNITMGSGSIGATAHSYTLGLPVLLRATAGTVPGPLVAETTYYAINTSANIVKLATTSAQAISNDPILLVSSTTSGTQTYTLIPLSISGTPSFKWQSSNNGTVWSDVNTSSVTMTSYTYGGATSMWDFSESNFSDYRLSVIAPTAGGIYINSVIDLIR